MRTRARHSWPQYLEHRMLGTTALYKVLGAADGLVDVEVIDAPGLRSGTRFGITEAAARGMRARSAAPRRAESAAYHPAGVTAPTERSAA